MEAEGPDGTIFEFPDDVHPDIVKSTISRHYAAQANPASDVAQSFVGGAERGAVGTLGLPGTVAQLANSAADVAARQTVGRLYNRFAPGGTGDFSADTRPDPGLAPKSIGPEAMLPNTQDVVGAYESVRGPTYQPQTTPGKYAASVGEMAGGSAFVPGAVVPKAVGAVSGGLGAVAAGQTAEQLGHPELAPYASVAGALATPVVAGRAITMFRTDPARMEAVNRLRQEGIPVSAGQQTGSPVLKYMESALGESPGGVQAAAGQQQAFNAAVGRRMGLPEGTEALTGDVMKGRAAEISRAYDDVLARNALEVDLPLTHDILGVASKYHDRVQLAQKPQFDKDLGLLKSEIQRQYGQLSGEQYQQLRSHFAQQARDFKGKDSAYAQANTDLKRALDAGWERSAAAAGNDADVAIKRTLDRQYRAQDTISKALAGSQNAALGDVSPFQLAASARTSSGTNATVRGTDDLASLALAARPIMRPPPNSGTAARQQILGLPQALGIGGGAMVGGPIGGMIGYAAPGLLSQVVNRRLGQAYLGNTLINDGVLSGAQALINAQKALGPDKKKGHEDARPTMRGLLGMR